MKCEYLDRFERGDLKESRFRAHARRCRTCRGVVESEDRLLSEVKELKHSIDPSPELWSRIEDELRSEIKPRAERRRIRLEPLNSLVFRTAAAFLLVVAVTVAVFFRPFGSRSGILGQGALHRIEKREAAYIDAINDLEKLALPTLSDLSLELMLLYRERLETIDDQIDRCREELQRNPGNAHIRKYMLAALQDKKQALTEIMAGEEK